VTSLLPCFGSHSISAKMFRSHKGLYCDCDNGTWLGANAHPSDVSEEARTGTQSQQTNEHSHNTCCEVK